MGGARAARGAGDGAAGEGGRWWGRAQAVRGGARSDLRSPPLEHPGEHRESLSTAAPGEGLHSSLEPLLPVGEFTLGPARCRYQRRSSPIQCGSHDMP
jgi:hypothetical protein